MASRNQFGFEPFRSVGAPDYPMNTVQRPYSQRLYSNTDRLGMIYEDREEPADNYRPLQRSSNLNHLQNTPVAQNPSIFRRITTSLRRGSSGASRSSSQRSQYTRVHDGAHDQVAIDLSSLEGLGLQLTSTSNTTRDPHTTHQYSSVTEYRGATRPENSPNIRDRRTRTLGYGMTEGVRLERDASVRIGHSDLGRARTVREVGQILAEERGHMVACDLTSLGGAGLNHRSSLNFDDMLDRPNAATESYFFPPDLDIPDWKPFTMRAPYIILLAFIAFGLAGFEECLYQVSKKKEGLLNFDNVDKVSVWNFFLWKYMPTMVTIFYATLFSIMDFNVRRLEPYYQLSQPQGARAAASLNLDHLTMFQYIVPFNAARLRQWAVAASSVANIIAATIAPALQNASVDFQTVGKGSNRGGGNGQENPQFKVIIDPYWSRAMSAAYVVVGLILVALLVQLRRKSGLQSDPKGIAGIASMATRSHILQDFNGLDTATRAKTHKRLAHRTYLLYKSTIWQGEWLTKPDPAEFRDSQRKQRSPHPVMLRMEAGIPFIIFMFLCLVAVPVISLTPARIVPNTVSWLPILVATFLKLIWSTFEADVRLIEPFYRLSKGRCTAKNSLTLDYQSTVYGWMPIRALLNGHYLLMLVGLSSVFLDILSVTIGSFSVNSSTFLDFKQGANDGGPSSEDETYVSFWVSLGLSCGILIFVMAVAILVYARRRHPFLPREPSTIASVLAFIYSSKMLDDFFDTEHLTGKQMENKLMALNKHYALGWFRGRDGKIHCAIDEEPMVSRYIHGVRYSDAVSGPMQGHETYV